MKKAVHALSIFVLVSALTPAAMAADDPRYFYCEITADWSKEKEVFQKIYFSSVFRKDYPSEEWDTPRKIEAAFADYVEDTYNIRLIAGNTHCTNDSKKDEVEESRLSAKRDLKQRGRTVIDTGWSY